MYKALEDIEYTSPKNTKFVIRKGTEFKEFKYLANIDEALYEKVDKKVKKEIK